MIALCGYEWTQAFEHSDKILAVYAVAIGVVSGGLTLFFKFSKFGRERTKRFLRIREIPQSLLTQSKDCVVAGVDLGIAERIYIPDEIRSRHVHILGSTGSGKTESVVLNFIKQDTERGLGSVILDAKGDESFLEALESFVPSDRLHVFDLSSEDSLGYDALAVGSSLESAQRLFSSLTWSEEYYKSKALTCLQRIFDHYATMHGRNPKLTEIAAVLESSKSYASFVKSTESALSVAKEFQELSGLRDQIRLLTLGHLRKILSPAEGGIDLNSARTGAVLYFRLQSLLSPSLVSILGKLLINHLSFLAGTAHRERVKAKQRKLVPIYLDEFASFACPEFADLISKGRSALFALHFSHQSVGDVQEVSAGFLTQITDNSATKIVLRINDPDSADFMARTFGTRIYQKTTQRITNAKDVEAAEIVGEGTTREAHQFRAAPDVLKTLPTGQGMMLVTHGQDFGPGASLVFRIQFPRLVNLRLPAQPTRLSDSNNSHKE